MAKSYLLIGKSRKTKETQGKALHVVFDVTRGVTSIIEQTDYENLVKGELVYNETDNFATISETRLNDNFERIAEGRTLIYHIHDLVERSTHNNVGFLLAFVNKEACYTQAFKSGELYGFLVSSADKRLINATPSNASLMMNNRKEDNTTGHPVAKFKAIKGSLRSVLV